ncbi:M20/M25/M40 family metallo-hydrolase [Mycobacterium sp. PS03-16]|uniref:M20/M25/M40 family metallo-hydrolase n=1 Tax=Mycobacterium sp. PS03-16 TaxID=2559611 RepID=UPI00107419EB|nr:M20/M25/M40 family metallo-hydrolase [Mycobacterium sp. PS03-16]TFV60237.1 M20/M25/M40 family metallo-hydrolase [Mycobacterium sp. PS03-16]
MDRREHPMIHYVGLQRRVPAGRAAYLLRDAIACCRFPSVSSDPRHRRDVRACASWLAQRYSVPPFRDVTIDRAGGQPLVVARSQRRAGYPHALLYGHFDVQPATPLSAWRSPPFEPQVRGDRLFARGASDDKGQLLTHLHAVEALSLVGPLPVDVTVVLDGAEEIGSPGLREWLSIHRRELDCEIAVISDTRMPGPDQPALTVGLRGSLSARIVVRGPATDLHAGAFGGAVLNPVHALSNIVAALHDRSGRITIDGFYDDVAPPARRGRDGACASDSTAIRRASGVPRLWGETGFSACERITIRPALNVTGITGGHVGPGNRSAIPAQARAVTNVRLVPDQQPMRIAELLRAFVAHHIPSAVTAEVTTLTATSPATIPVDRPVLAAAANSLARAFGERPRLVRSGGTIPAVSMIEEQLGAVPVLMGFGLPDDNMHAADESTHLPTLLRGVDALVDFFASLHPVGEGVTGERYSAPGYR